MVEISYLKLFSPNDLVSSMYCPKKPGILVPSWNLQTLLSSFVLWIHMSSISLLATLSENTIERIMKCFRCYTDSTYKIYYTYITKLEGDMLFYLPRGDRKPWCVMSPNAKALFLYAEGTPWLFLSPGDAYSGISPKKTCNITFLNN